MAMLRYGFALGSQKAVDIIGKIEPDSAGRMAEVWWKMKQFPDYHDARMKVNELETDQANQLDPFSREHLTSITYAWEERTTAMLRYGFALGHQEAVAVIQGAAPEQAARMTQAGWRTAKETGMTDW